MLILRSLITAFSLIPSQQKPRFCLLIFLGIIGAVLEMVGIGAVVPAITFLVGEDTNTAMDAYPMVSFFVSNPTKENIAIVALSILLGVFLIKNIFIACLALLTSKFIFGLRTHVAVAIFSKYLNSNYEEITRNPIGLSIRNVTTETDKFLSHVLVPSVALIIEGTVLVGVIAVVLLHGASWRVHTGHRGFFVDGCLSVNFEKNGLILGYSTTAF